MLVVVMNSTLDYFDSKTCSKILSYLKHLRKNLETDLIYCIIYMCAMWLLKNMSWHLPTKD